MPIYDYQCTGCRYNYEVNHRIDEQYQGSCPLCGCKSEKQMSATYGKLANGAVGNTQVRRSTL